MQQKWIDAVTAKQSLAIFTDNADAVLWQSNASPVSALSQQYFQNTLPEAKYHSLYANQLGIALALYAKQFGVSSCYACKVSQYGLQVLQQAGIAVTYEELIPLVHSSKNESEVCPIEQYLADHPGEEERWSFLKDRFTGEQPAGRSCSIFK